MANHRILYAQTENYGFLALSVETPRFCVAGKTKEEAKAKASAALDFYRSYEDIEKNYEENRRKEHSEPDWYEEDKLCA